MKSQQKHNWIVDAVLLVGFLLLFFMDITGLSLHQWLGVAVGVIVGYHLLSHSKWLLAVITRFFGRTSNQARGFLLLDFAILGGLATIGFTGLIMSTWLNLTLAYYDAWHFVHVLSSIATLLLVVFKIALHGKWIVTVARNVVFAPKKAAVADTATAAATPAMAPVSVNSSTRRQFLGMMGVVGAASLVALAEAAGSLRIPQLDGESTSAGSQTASTDDESTSDSQGNLEAVVETAVAATAVPSTAAGNVEVEEVVEATAVPTAQSVQVVEVTAVSCTTRCRKGNHCSYPGKCHDYVDRDGNGLCDKGECS